MDEHEKRILEIPRVKEVLELIGLITITWNSIESLWYLIFTCLLHETPRGKVDRIFKQFNSGALQRQMIMSLADVTFPEESSEFKKELKILRDKTNELSALRNDITHGVYFFDPLNGVPGLRIAPMGSMNRRANKLSEVGTELVSELNTVFERLDTHEKELDDFRLILAQEYLPDRLKNRPLPKETLDSMPLEVRNSLPRQLRERIAPPRLRAKD